MLKHCRNAEHTESLIQSYLLMSSADKPRNARLALVKYYSMEPISTAHEIHQDTMLKTICEYFQDYSTRLACFHDLQPYLMPLKPEQRESFLIQIATYVESIKPNMESSEASNQSLFEANLLTVRIVCMYCLVDFRDQRTEIGL